MISHNEEYMKREEPEVYLAEHTAETQQQQQQSDDGTAAPAAAAAAGGETWPEQLWGAAASLKDATSQMPVHCMSYPDDQ